MRYNPVWHKLVRKGPIIHRERERERERESSMESGPHGCISSFSSLAEKQLWSVWKKRMFLPIMRALQTATSICDWIQRLYFHFVHHTLTREPLVYDKYSPSPFKFSCGTLREFVKSQVHTNRCVQMIRALLREMQLCSLKKWINAGSEVELLTLQFQSKDLCISDLEMNPKYLFNV